MKTKDGKEFDLEKFKKDNNYYPYDKPKAKRTCPKHLKVYLSENELTKLAYLAKQNNKAQSRIVRELVTSTLF